MTDVDRGIDFVHNAQVSTIEGLINESLDESPVLFHGHGVAPPCLPTHLLEKAGHPFRHKHDATQKSAAHAPEDYLCILSRGIPNSEHNTSH